MSERKIQSKMDGKLIVSDFLFITILIDFRVVEYDNNISKKI